MASVKAVQGLKHVKPILSADHSEARKRVLSLYRAWYRQAELVVADYDLTVTVAECRAKVRENFEKNRNVTDVRVIDMLFIKGQHELEETKNIWKQKNHVMNYFNQTVNPKPADFFSKFLEGHEP
ncbi:NADH dehydrogenase [ubiquinone] 1 alpha subcomplex subunit 6-like [Ruditapes philippinarum]|uniref:NADH dehydrogenase [ubiquinone] 1 alpha subcomplex subunit 6-like n=1 Tax=Ruditapes philippinarum TaxID=129788 RepID=UPI001E6E3E2A